jgi:hypothetical protein
MPGLITVIMRKNMATLVLIMRDMAEYSFVWQTAQADPSAIRRK